MLLILSKKYYFRGVDTAYIKQYTLIFEGWIVLILSMTQYFRGVDAAYTKQ